MGLFKPKVDIERDNLKFGFDLEEQKYYIYYMDVYIPYKNLIKKSKKVLNKKNQELINNPELLKQEIEKAKIRERYDKLKSMGYSCNSFEILGENKTTMSEDMEKFLIPLINEENVLLGVHRIGYTFTEQILEDILLNGIKMTGNIGSGSVSSIYLRDNISYYADNKIIIKELGYANLYKNSPGSFLIRIPDDELGENIYYVNEKNELRLKPEYILGYIPTNERHHIERIITANDIRKKQAQTDDYENYQDYYSEEFEQETTHRGR